MAIVPRMRFRSEPRRGRRSHRCSGGAGALAAALALAWAVAGCGDAGEAPALRAGAGVAILPIPVGHSHAGYLQSDALGAPHPPDDPKSPFADLFPATRGLQSAPRAKALVLESGSRRLVLAQVDAVFVTATLTARVLALARKRLGVDLRGELLLHGSHTHGSAGRFSDRSPMPTLLAAEPVPQRHVLAHGVDTYSPESTDRIAAGIVEAIDAAFASRRRARFGWAQGESPDASRDRRCHDDWIEGALGLDTALTVLRVDAEDGAPIAVLVHFALHGTIYDHDSRNLSVDAPGHVEYAIERRFDRPVVAIFLQGAAASASPNADVLGHAGSQAMQRIGEVLADEALALYATITPRDRITLRYAVRRLPIDARRLGYRGDEFPAHGALLCHLLDATCGSGPSDPGALDCIGRIEPGDGKYETWIAAAVIGDLALFALPGEPSAELGRELSRRAAALGHPHAIPLGYSLDHDGYLLLEDDWLSGGSETNITFWGWRYARHLLEESVDLLASIERAAAAGSDAFARAEAIDPAPVDPSPSEGPPEVTLQPPPQVERMAEIDFAFLGGDPALGTPEVRLQVQRGARWADVLSSGWIPVSNLRGPELPTFYEAEPSWKERSEPVPRRHRWRVRYEPPRDLPEGNYRFVARGAAIVGERHDDYELASQPFAVVPSTRMRAEAVVVDGVLHVTLLHPERRPVWHEEPRNDGWQIGGFRAVDVRFDPAFVPVLDGVAVEPLTIDAGPIDLAFVQRPLPAGARRYDPGAGPGFTAALPSGARTLQIPARALRDRFGNTHGEPIRVAR